MKFINLRDSAYVNGQLRHPNEGVLHLANEEADRLVKEKLADDVTADFDAIENDEEPVEHITAAEPATPAKGKAKA